MICRVYLYSTLIDPTNWMHEWRWFYEIYSLLPYYYRVCLATTFPSFVMQCSVLFGMNMACNENRWVAVETARCVQYALPCHSVDGKTEKHQGNGFSLSSSCATLRSWTMNCTALVCNVQHARIRIFNRNAAYCWLRATTNKNWLTKIAGKIVVLDAGSWLNRRRNIFANRKMSFILLPRHCHLHVVWTHALDTREHPQWCGICEMVSSAQQSFRQCYECKSLFAEQRKLQ